MPEPISVGSTIAFQNKMVNMKWYEKDVCRNSVKYDTFEGTPLIFILYYLSDPSLSFVVLIVVESAILTNDFSVFLFLPGVTKIWSIGYLFILTSTYNSSLKYLCSKIIYLLPINDLMTENDDLIYIKWSNNNYSNQYFLEESKI